MNFKLDELYPNINHSDCKVIFHHNTETEKMAAVEVTESTVFRTIHKHYWAVTRNYMIFYSGSPTTSLPTERSHFSDLDPRTLFFLGKGIFFALQPLKQ